MIVLPAFQHCYVTANLVLDNRNVDLVYENFDLAIKYGRPADQALIIRRLGSIRRILVASPEFLNRFDPIDTVERLSEVGLIASAALLASRDVLTLRHSSGELVDISVSRPAGRRLRHRHPILDRRIFCIASPDRVMRCAARH